MKNRYVMGIDGGTESVRAGIFDLSGRPIVYASEECGISLPRSGWAEQDPDEWDKALKKAIRKAVKESGLDARQIIGVSADATIGTLVFLDKNQQHIGKAILWMDVRAAPQFERMKSTGHPVLILNPTAEWPVPKMMWVRDNMPEVYRETKTVLEYTSWLVLRMTGRIVASCSNASSRWCYDRAKGGYPLDFYSMLGLDELVRKLPADTRFVDDIAGRLSEEFAAATGLPAGIPVAVGCPDGISALIGLNAFTPGTPVMICGTSHVHLFTSETEFHAKGIIGSYPDAIKEGLHTIEGGQVTTGAVLKWYRDGFLPQHVSRAAHAGMSAYEYIDRLASDIPIGSEGLVMLEYFQGNRTPHQDPYARGAVWGLSLRHTPLHVYRAIMEGVAYGTRRIFDTIRGKGPAIQRVIVCGGMTKSDLWLKIHADVCGIPLILTEVQDASVLGAAIVAARVAGAYATLDEAAESMVRQRRVIEPDPAAHGAYDFFYGLYRDTYPGLRDVMQKMSVSQTW